ncbi:hypothetical protein EDC19_0103 [Natranaerovirga hydrolytica]|uniref:Uncharacterized protein n=1 Tax=Natranaerovirga hydrolytica TaxID=680378 RepID=A0A4R1N5D3_9FIRM|nr:hypothetical protein [Natranaerovirga hydrolytica]TCK99483.1 hypothetical protein EDC19_0103 [Natranaerovirga hydrolytica]
MSTKVNPDYLESLALDFKRYGEVVEDNEKGLQNSITRMLDEVKARYHEPNVRNRVAIIENLLHQLRKEAIEETDWARKQKQELINIAGQTRQEEHQITELFQNNRQTYPTVRSRLWGGRPPTLGKYSNTPRLSTTGAKKEIDPIIFQYIFTQEVKNIDKTRFTLKDIHDEEFYEYVKAKAQKEHNRIYALETNLETEFENELDRMRMEIRKFLNETKGGKWTRSIAQKEVHNQEYLTSLITAGIAFVDIAGIVYFNEKATQEDRLMLFNETYTTYSKDGNWLKLLEKENTEITDIEIDIIALNYLKGTDEEKELFLNTLYQTKPQISGYKWGLDEELTERLIKAIETNIEKKDEELYRIVKQYNALDEELEELINSYKIDKEYRLQDLAVIKALTKIGDITSSEKEIPGIKLIRGENQTISLEYLQRDGFNQTTGLSMYKSININIDKPKVNVLKLINTMDSNIEADVEKLLSSGEWRELISRHSSEIKVSEYIRLGIVFTELSHQQQEEFINLCLINTGEYFMDDQNRSKPFTFNGVEFLIWEADTEKFSMLENVMYEIFTDNFNNIYTSPNDFNSVLHCSLLQHQGIFNVLSQMDKILLPDIEHGHLKLNEEIKNEKDIYEGTGNIIINYIEYDNLCVAFKSAKISRGLIGADNTIFYNDNLKDKFDEKYKVYTRMEAVLKTIGDKFDSFDFMDAGDNILEIGSQITDIPGADTFGPVSSVANIIKESDQLYKTALKDRAEADLLIEETEGMSYAARFGLTGSYITWHGSGDIDLIRPKPQWIAQGHPYLLDTDIYPEIVTEYEDFYDLKSLDMSSELERIRVDSSFDLSHSTIYLLDRYNAIYEPKDIDLDKFVEYYDENSLRIARERRITIEGYPKITELDFLYRPEKVLKVFDCIRICDRDNYYDITSPTKTENNPT